jgi:hypothetical protein
MRYIRISLIMALLLHGSNIFAQYYNTGQDPAALKWMQVKTDHFTVIYPEEYGQQGISFAKSLDSAASNLTALFPDFKFRLPVVIHNFTTQSNGYVAWAPKRMEIYPTPEQNTIPLDPDQQLATHEMTHVFQMLSLNQGFSKAVSYGLGEQYTGLISSLLPLWLLEGEAVFAESYLTPSGRGRTPSFQKQLKALTVENGKPYKYDKIINDSYRDFVPSYYETGYQMVTWAYASHGPQIWNSVMRFTADEPFTINPVNISLRRNVQLTKKKLYYQTLDTLKQIWTREIRDNGSVEYDPVSPDKNGNYINYYSPVSAGTDSIIAIKTSLSDPPCFVLIRPSERSEKRIHIPGYMYPWFISYGNNRLVWVENQPDARWDNRNYSVIRVLDLKSGVTHKLTNRTRYMTAAISPDGKRIVAVENTPDNRNNLVFIDPVKGTIEKTLPTPNNLYLQHPQWSVEGNSITFIGLGKDGESIISYTPADNLWETLIEAGRTDMQSSFLRNDTLYFISSENGTDNILMRTGDNRLYRLTNSRFGTSDLSYCKNKIIFSDYTSTGNNICAIRATNPFELRSPASHPVSPLLDRITNKPVPSKKLKNITYSPLPYRKWQHLFRFHSWMPFYADLEEIKSDPSSIRPGISLMSQNTLSTLLTSIGYEYSATKRSVLHTRVTWEGWYPIIETQLDYGEIPQVYKLGESVNDPPSIQPLMVFTNTIKLPLLFSSGMFTQFLQASFTSKYSNKYIYLKETGYYDYGQTIINGRLYFSNYRIYAYRDIYPRWAQNIDLNYSSAPFDKAIYGKSYSFASTLYFPGFIKNNGIRLRYDVEKQDPSKYLYGSMVNFPRGYNNIISTRINFLSADYVFPLIYPDLTVSSLLYLKRIRAGLFFDYASGTDNYYYNVLVNNQYTNVYHKGNETFSSFGFNLLSDLHVLRIPFMISAGVQAAWKDPEKSPVLELLFNMDLFGMNIGSRRASSHTF